MLEPLNVEQRMMELLPAIVLPILLCAVIACGSEPGLPLAGATEKTPSRAHYFSWINQLDSGPTESQTLANIAFFKYLKDEFGMQLDIYAWDEGALDHGRGHETLDSPRFRKLFPNGFDRCVETARAGGIRLGIWGGPDGFGNTPEEEKARIAMYVKFCRDYQFAVFKFDGVGGDLRTEKQDAFARMMTECRQYCPDLILLNHRLNLGKAMPHATTSLWEGQETYVDVKMSNSGTGTHNRIGNLARGLPPQLTRLVEDHGVCLSSCLDYWDDDLILQAFNRCMILAPEIYGDPWFLSDEELPRLARLFNLHRHYRDILVEGMELPEAQYGPKAVSRGSDATRFLTLRNLTWNPVKYKVRLDKSIGLALPGDVTLRQFHPEEKDLGTFPDGSEVEVAVAPFRACLLMATVKPIAEVGVTGVAYEVVRDLPGKPVLLKLLGSPGSRAEVKLCPGSPVFADAKLDGQPASALAQGQAVTVEFPGIPLKEPWHRKLGALEPVPVPADSEALFEATCFSSDNDTLACRAVARSGPTRIPAVQAARDAFFKAPLFLDRGVWCGFLFDGDPKTYFRNTGADNVIRSDDCLLRIDFGAPIQIDRLQVTAEGSDAKPTPAQVSADLAHWTTVETKHEGKSLILSIPPAKPVRYVRLFPGDWRLNEVEGSLGGSRIDRAKWKASNLFWNYSKVAATAAWSATYTLPEVPPGSYLCVALEGRHGREGAYAAARVDGRLVGAPNRAPSMLYNQWETSGGQTDRNYTYFIPLTADMAGKPVDVVVLTLRKGVNEYKPQTWITAYPAPHVTRMLELQSVAK